MRSAPDRRRHRSEAALPARRSRWRAATRRDHVARISSPTNRRCGRSRTRPARGVRVRVLVESDITDAKPVKYASRAAATSDLLSSSASRSYEYQPTMMHAKSVVVDGVLEHLRIGELRQPVARAERRVERRRVQPRRRGPISRGFREGSACFQAAGARDLAPAAAAARGCGSISGAISGRFLILGSLVSCLHA